MQKILTSWEIIAHIDVSVTGDIRLVTPQRLWDVKQSTPKTKANA